MKGSSVLEYAIADEINPEDSKSGRMWLNYKEWLKNLVMVLFPELYRTHLLRIKYLHDITSFTVSVLK